MRRKWWIWLIGGVTGLVTVAITLGLFIDEPLRRYMERQLNTHLQGYTVRVGKLDLHPLSFSIELFDVAIMQDANPESAIVYVPRLSSSVQWSALLSAHVVSDILVERPQIHINLKQIRQEAEDDLPLKERGWQEAVQAVTPVKVNLLRVVEAEVTYLDQEPLEPLRLSHLNLHAENIRNIRSEVDEYPSPLHLQGMIFGTGNVWLDGHADFLATPHIAVKAQLGLEHVPLGYVKPIASRYSLVLNGGILSGTGAIEYSPTHKVAHLQKATVHGLRIDYLHSAQTVVAEQKRGKQVRQAAQQVSNAPGLLLRADEVSIVKSQMGFINEAANPHYRLFLTDLEVHLTNFSNHLTEGTSIAKVTGKFMDSGQTLVGATFRPETNGPDFALASSIENTDMQAMNQLLRAHGNFDVVRGFFSVYTELRVKNGAVRGYIKPLFKEMDVYDVRQDQEKNLFQKIYEGLVGGVSQLLENSPRQEVVTKADIAGHLDNPQASTWQVLVNLIQNAFFQAILPGFERELRNSRR